MQMGSVNTGDLIEHIDFANPARDLFESDKVAEQLQTGLKTFNGNGKQPQDNKARGDMIKQAVFQKGAEIAQLMKKKRHEDLGH